MNYRISCRNSYPYRNWYADINNLKLHIEERCKEIVEKYHEQTVNYDTKIKGSLQRWRRMWYDI